MNPIISCKRQSECPECCCALPHTCICKFWIHFVITNSRLWFSTCEVKEHYNFNPVPLTYKSTSYFCIWNSRRNEMTLSNCGLLDLPLCIIRVDRLVVLSVSSLRASTRIAQQIVANVSWSASRLSTISVYRLAK